MENLFDPTIPLAHIAIFTSISLLVAYKISRKFWRHRRGLSRSMLFKLSKSMRRIKLR
jgi:hypothetical protein